MISDSRVRAVARAPIGTFLCLVTAVFFGGCATVVSNGSSTPSDPPTSAPTPEAIAVSTAPAAATVSLSQIQKITATVTNDHQNKGVSWNISGGGCSGSGCGTLSAGSSASGEAIAYTAPAQMPATATLSVTATSDADSTKSAAVAITLITPASIGVSVMPVTSTVGLTNAQNFTATVQNDTQNKGVAWKLSGTGCVGNACGTLSSSSTPSGTPVTYRAPTTVPNPPTVVLTATSLADSSQRASATITVAKTASGVSVSVSPTSQSLTVKETHNFTATVQNDPQNRGVTWSLSGSGCAGSACGTLSSTSTASGAAVGYTAPSTVPNPATIKLTATSVSNPGVAASATITVGKAAVLTTVSVSPTSRTLVVNGSDNFTATVQNDPQNGGVRWSLSGSGCAGSACGTLSSTSTASGTPVTYTAPSKVPTATITLTATSVSNSSAAAKATITIIGLPSNLGVTLSPKRAGLTVSQAMKFTAVVQNDPTQQGVTWTATAGTFTSETPTSAIYHAPAQPGVFTIIATSVLDVTKAASATVGVTDLSGVTTYHNDLSRDGVNAQEYALTTSNVNKSVFGKVFSCAVDAAVYTQPLWVANVAIGGGTHNVIFVGSSHSTVYAFDADAIPCVKYWSRNLIPPGETWPTAADMGSEDIEPDLGIVGTPVIDLSTNILYVVAKTKVVGTNARGPGQCRQRLHALKLSDGGETANGAVELTSSISVAGSGDGGNGVRLPFDPFHENQRAGLALVNGTVYVGWGSHTDQKPWHGWTMGFNKSNLAAAPLLFNATPNGEGGGIWMAGGAPAADSSNNLYVITGNGNFDGAKNFGDSFLKLTPSLGVSDWFTPSDQAILDTANQDLGAGGAALLADLPSAPVKHLVIGGGKAGSGNLGELYVVNRDAMGHLEGAGKSVVQKFAVGDSLYATPAFWQNTLFIAGSNGPLLAFTLNPTTGQFNPSPTSRSSELFLERGSIPSVSSNGNSHGIVWTIDTSKYGGLSHAGTGPAVLHAYDASNLTRELWNSAQAAGNRDQAGNAVKFTVPTIANGKVYIGTTTEITVYGLLPD